MSKKGFAILLFFLGIGFILYGLYLEGATSKIALPGGRLAAAFMMVVLLVVMWFGLSRLGKATDRSNSGAVRGFGNIIFGVGILVSLIILGAIIFEIAQYSKENEIDKPSQSSRPTTAAPRPANRTTSNTNPTSSSSSSIIPNAVTSFYIMRIKSRKEQISSEL